MPPMPNRVIGARSLLAVSPEIESGATAADNRFPVAAKHRQKSLIDIRYGAVVKTGDRDRHRTGVEGFLEPFFTAREFRLDLRALGDIDDQAENRRFAIDRHLLARNEYIADFTIFAGNLGWKRLDATVPLKLRQPVAVKQPRGR